MQLSSQIADSVGIVSGFSTKILLEPVDFGVNVIGSPLAPGAIAAQEKSLTMAPVPVPNPPHEKPVSSRPPMASEISFSEIVSALTFAIDLTEGAVPGHALRTCILGMRIADAIHLPVKQLSLIHI